MLKEPIKIEEHEHWYYLRPCPSNSGGMDFHTSYTLTYADGSWEHVDHLDSQHRALFNRMQAEKWPVAA